MYIKFQELMHQFCYIVQISIYYYMSKSEKISNRLLVINWLIENLETPIN